MKHKPIIKWILAPGFIVLSACGLSTPTATQFTARPPLTTAFNCLPPKAAFIAAHRGTSYDSRYSENSIGGLNALIQKGYFFAEIDVARLRDNTHILMHDGVFDRTTVKKGVVVSSRWPEVKGQLLKDRSGRITRDSVPKLSDYLRIANQRIYLEIDFKSSANYADVIELIRAANMQQHVILIAYSNGQARKLARLAPEMKISVPIKTPQDINTLTAAGISTPQIAAWLSNAQLSKSFTANLQNQNIPILKKAPRTNVTLAAKDANIMVDNYAFQLKPIMGMSISDRAEFENCMTITVKKDK